jgi:formylglycine-generating enzyme required for sulfatase activity
VEFAIMKSNPMILRIIFLLSIFLFIYCSDTSQSPFTPDNASISIVLESSNGTHDGITISDTVECKARIGITKYLPSYIDSTVIIVGKSASDTETVFHLKNMLSSPDTMWSEIIFHSTGNRTVTATAYLKKGKLYIVTGEIKIVGKPIQIITDPTNVIAKEDSSAFFTVKTSGTPPFTYQWVKDGIGILNVNKDTLFIGPVKLLNAGRYVCLIKDQWGDSISSDTAVLTVIQKPPQNIKPVFVTDSPKVFYSIDAGQFLSFTIKAIDQNNDSVAYLLKLSETTLPHKTDCTITGQTVTWQSHPADTGSFLLVLGATDGINQTLDTVTIVVNKPTFDITVTSAGNGTVTPSATQRIAIGGELSISGQPSASYGFSDWTVTGGLTLANLKDSATKVLNVQGPGTVTAHFVKVYKITVQSEKRGTTMPTGDVYVKENQYLDISAACPSAFEFIKWSKVSGSLTIADSTLASTQIGPVTAAATVKAGFRAKGMKLIPAGSFNETNGFYTYSVTTTKSFWMDSTEVTRQIWSYVIMDSTSTSTMPQAMMSWTQAVLYCNKLSLKCGLDTSYTYSGIARDSLANLSCNWSGPGYRLPSEDEWEHACRAGTSSTYFWGNNDSTLANQYMWSSGSMMEQPVATKKPNPWGLYDMCGNYWEWVWDLFADRPSGARMDYRGPTATANADYVVKGGSWRQDAPGSAWRMSYPNMASGFGGFRIVLPDPGE